MVHESFDFYVRDMNPDEQSGAMKDAGVSTVEALVDNLSKEVEDKVKWTGEQFGPEQVTEQIKKVLKKLSSAQLEEIAKKAVDLDGPGHFISGWDSKLTPLDGGLQLAMW